MPRTSFPLFLVTLLAGAITAPSAHAYAKLGYCWLGGEVTLHLQLGAPSSPLTDGSTSWNAAGAAAAGDWNLHSGRVRLVTFAEPPPSTNTERDLVNNVFFASDIYGLAFDSRTLAVTYPNTMHATATETDVIVNSNLKWDSYRGPLRGTSDANAVYDLRRVLLHEFGHVLGLNHPDTATPAQSVAAMMNSTISNLESLTSDDITGVTTLYFPNGAVSMTTQPQNVTKSLNEIVTFTGAARATNGDPVTYAWMFTRPGGQPERLELSDSNIFVLGGAQPADGGTYQLLAYTTNGAVVSAPATLTIQPVTTSPSTRLANISTRGLVGTGGNALISGFVIGGSGAKPVLVRAIGGTTLGGFGVAGTLPDPQLTVFDSGGRIVAANNNWGDANGSAIAAAASRLGGFTLPNGSTDAALLLNLSPGNYTAQVTGVNNTTGVALVEVYDADADDATALTHKLGNLSTRGSIGPNGVTLIAGLVVRGTLPRTFFIRAIGPTLSQFGLANALVDPVLTLKNASGAQIRYNDDWDFPVGSMPATRATAQSVGAFSLVEKRDILAHGGLDSVMTVTLAPGNYTAEVAGFGTATGVALVEIYELNP